MLAFGSIVLARFPLTDPSGELTFCNALRNVLDSLMPPGPKPFGERALTPAERQARYRAAHAGPAPVVKVRYRQPTDRRSRPQRWAGGGRAGRATGRLSAMAGRAAGEPGGHAHG